MDGAAGAERWKQAAGVWGVKGRWLPVGQGGAGFVGVMDWRQRMR